MLNPRTCSLHFALTLFLLFLTACSDQGFQVANKNSAATSTHVIQGPLRPTTSEQRRNLITLTEPDRRTDRQVSLADIDVRFENLQVRADFRDQKKRVEVRFDLIRNGLTLKYELDGEFSEEGQAILDVKGNTFPEHQRYFRAIARCVNQCGQVIIDLKFRSETREFRAQFESELHPDFRTARSSLDTDSGVRPQEPSAPSTEDLPDTTPDGAEGEIGEGPGEWVTPVLPRTFLEQTPPLVRDQELPQVGSQTPQAEVSPQTLQTEGAIPPRAEPQATPPQATPPSSPPTDSNPQQVLPPADDASPVEGQTPSNSLGESLPPAPNLEVEPEDGDRDDSTQNNNNTEPNSVEQTPPPAVPTPRQEPVPENSEEDPRRAQFEERARQMGQEREARIRALELNRAEAERQDALRRLEEQSAREVEQARQNSVARERVAQLARDQAKALEQRQEALRRAQTRQTERRLQTEAQQAAARAALLEQEQRTAAAQAEALEARRKAALANIELEDLEQGRALLSRMAEFERTQAALRRSENLHQMRIQKERADAASMTEQDRVRQRQAARAEEAAREQIRQITEAYERDYLKFQQIERRREQREAQQRQNQLALRGQLPEQQRRHHEIQRLRIQKERADERAMTLQRERDAQLPLPPPEPPPAPPLERPAAPTPSQNRVVPPSQNTNPVPPTPPARNQIVPQVSPSPPSTQPRPQQGGFQAPLGVVSGFIERVWNQACTDTNIAARFPLFPCPNLGSRHAGKAEGHYGMRAGCNDQRTFCWNEQRGNLISGSRLTSSASYRFLSPNRIFGSGITILFLEALARNIQQVFNAQMQIGDVSQLHGGKIDPHKSHQNGLDIDLYTFKLNRGTFDAERNWTLLKMIHSFDLVHRIYTSRENKKEICLVAKRLNELESHKDILQKLVFVQNHTLHFHIRLQCTPHNGQTCRNDGSRIDPTELCSSRYYNVR